MSEVDEPVVPEVVDDNADHGDEAGQQDQQRQADEAEARRAGWRPKEEFQGDPAKWVEASEFNRRGREHVPILRKNVERLTGEVRELREANKQFAEFQKQARDKEVKRLNDEISAIKAQQLVAVQSGDTQAYLQSEQAIKQRTEAMPPEPAPVPQQQEQLAPEAVQFKQRNQWFGRDKALTATANGIHLELQDTEPGLTLQENLERVEAEVKRRFPEKFSNPNRTRPGAVDSPSIGGRPRPGKKTYSDLPQEAKAACDKFVRTIPGYSRDKYLADYSWD